jgi:hypothetical protein
MGVEGSRVWRLMGWQRERQIKTAISDRKLTTFTVLSIYFTYVIFLEYTHQLYFWVEMY